MKLLFFDIDGTLLGKNKTFPESTRIALRKAQGNGHKICVASGRSKGNLPEVIKDINWDGYILGSGMYGEYQGTVIQCEYLEQKQVTAFLDDIEQNEEFEVVLECNEGSYLTASGQHMMYQKIVQSGYFSPEAEQNVFSGFTVVKRLQGVRQINKMMYFSVGDTALSIIERFRNTFDFLPNSVILGDDYSNGEIMKKGITKAVGIARLRAFAGFSEADVIAFGDGYNDIEMIGEAGIGVAMGNSVDALKKVADRITDDLEQDGIYNALQALHLI